MYKRQSLPGVVTSDGLLDKKDMFEHLIIIGGGVIGMEFASVYLSLIHISCVSMGLAQGKPVGFAFADNFISSEDGFGRD